MTRNIDHNSRQRGLLTANKQEIFEINSCFLTEVLRPFWADLIVPTPFHSTSRISNLLSVTNIIPRER